VVEKMSKKILYCATVDYHFKAFHLPYMRWFCQQGWEVHVAAKGNIELPYCSKKFNIPIERSPFSTNNIRAYFQLKKIIEEEQYDIVHSHTPMGGVLARLAARKARKKGTKSIYTAHGFHFCKGSSMLSWLIYYPLEKWLSHYTDCLITINNEDYELAKRHKFKAGEIVHVHGVGVDTERFKPVSEDEKIAIREKYGYEKNNYLIYYAAEFNRNKNQEVLIKAVAKARDQIYGIKLLLIGEGPLLDKCVSISEKLGVQNIVEFLEFRKDVDEIAKMCDAAVSASFREGLPVNIMEAMACGKPIIASNNRGHRELVKSGVNGFLISDNDENMYANKLIELWKSDELQKRFGSNSYFRVQPYALYVVLEEMTSIYQNYINTGAGNDGISDKSAACSGEYEQGWSGNFNNEYLQEH